MWHPYTHKGKAFTQNKMSKSNTKFKNKKKGNGREKTIKHALKHFYRTNDKINAI